VQGILIEYRVVIYKNMLVINHKQGAIVTTKALRGMVTENKSMGRKINIFLGTSA
jgi:hypothetical protein